MTWAAGAGNGFHANGPFGLAAARSLIGGLTPDIKFGASGAITTDRVTIWPHTTLYAYQAAATKLKVSSGSAADDLGSTGMEKVLLYGLDENWLEITEEVILNGQAQVETDAEFLRIYRAIGTQYGSGGTNAGIVYAGTGSAITGVPQTTVDMVIAAGDGQTLMALRPVPAGKRMFIECLHLSVGEGKTLVGFLAHRPFGGGFAVKWTETIFQTAIERTDLWFGPYEEKSDVEMRGISSASGTVASAAFRYHLIDH